ncbi:hypothetical protein U5A85_28380, partial [Priestia megaterium]
FSCFKLLIGGQDEALHGNQQFCSKESRYPICSPLDRIDLVMSQSLFFVLRCMYVFGRSCSYIRMKERIQQQSSAALQKLLQNPLNNLQFTNILFTIQGSMM